MGAVTVLCWVALRRFLNVDFFMIFFLHRLIASVALRRELVGVYMVRVLDNWFLISLAVENIHIALS